MPIKFRQVGPTLGAEVDGIDISKPLSKADAAAIHAGMDKYAVLVFREQKIDDEQQLAFTQGLGDIEHAIGTSLRSDNDSACRRRSPTSPISTRTTSRSRATTGAGCSPSATGSGTRTARSRSSRRSTRCCTRAAFRPRAAIPSSPTCGPPMTRSTRRPKAWSRTWSASIRRCTRARKLGFMDFTDEERERFKPVRQRLVRTHPYGAQVAVPVVARRHDRRLASARGTGVPHGSDRGGDTARVRLHRTNGASAIS